MRIIIIIKFASFGVQYASFSYIINTCLLYTTVVAPFVCLPIANVFNVLL